LDREKIKEHFSSSMAIIENSKQPEARREYHEA
jgi:hypothetical protein